MKIQINRYFTDCQQGIESMLVYRDYQEDIRNKVYKGWEHYQNILVNSPTGSGKTVIFCGVMADFDVAMAIAHRQELVSQMSLTLAKNEIKHRIFAIELCFFLLRRVQIYGV